ncbi:MAG: hypothetical protein SOV79_13240, partial [Eisenbergiella porci]|uniref:hypothetical protein n=1 Tax=Eisenbergiella porci TaxID=2652274 RepID=UPI002A76221D
TAKIHPKSPLAMDFSTPESLSYGQRSKCTDLLNSYTVPIHYKQNFSMGQAKPGNFGGLRVSCRHCPAPPAGLHRHPSRGDESSMQGGGLRVFH